MHKRAGNGDCGDISCVRYYIQGFNAGKTGKIVPTGYNILNYLCDAYHFFVDIFTCKAIINKKGGGKRGLLSVCLFTQTYLFLFDTLLRF